MIYSLLQQREKKNQEINKMNKRLQKKIKKNILKNLKEAKVKNLDDS